MKKKRFFMLFFLLFVMLFSVGCLGSSNVYAYYPTSSAVSSDDIKNVCDTIGLTYTNTSLNSRASAVNLLLTDKSANIGNIVFYTDGTNLYAILQSGTIGDTFPELAVYKNSLGNITVRQHNGFIFSGEEIIGVSPATNITKYLLSPANGTYTESTGNIVIYGNISFSGSFVEVSTQICATWSANATASWDGYSQDDSLYGWRFLRPYVSLSGWVAPTSTPTPTPTPTSTPVGGGSTDLTLTNTYIAEVKDEVHNARVDSNERLDEIISKIPTSGDLVQSTVTANEEYWGTDIDSGEVQDNFSGDLVGIIDSMSGDLNSNKAVAAFQDFEESFLALLSSSNPLDLDFIIDYPNINTLTFNDNGNVDGEQLLISADSLNLSQMCRDNATLGNIQDTVRMLFNFGFGVSLIIYVYNLIISTLGIDNPFLYDDPETMHISIMDDVNDNGTVTSYITRTRSNRLKHISKSTRGRIHYD